MNCLNKNEHILVVGHKGNMGSRYTTILNYLGVHWTGIDKDQILINNKYTGIIIATPTGNHVEDILDYQKYNIPILCEKPITTCLMELDEALSVKCPLRMINQYEYYLLPKAYKIKKHPEYRDDPSTYYNYFKSGKDGLICDCINLIGLANPKGTIEIRNDSPIWTAVINDHVLDIQEMDHAYIWNIKDWLLLKNDNRDYIKLAHERMVSLWNES